MSPPPHCPGTCLCDYPGVRTKLSAPSSFPKLPAAGGAFYSDSPSASRRNDPPFCLAAAPQSPHSIYCSDNLASGHCDRLYFLVVFITVRSTRPSFIHTYLPVFFVFSFLVFFLYWYGVFFLSENGAFCWGGGCNGTRYGIMGCLPYFLSFWNTL